MDGCHSGAGYKNRFKINMLLIKIIKINKFQILTRNIQHSRHIERIALKKVNKRM